MTAAEPTMIRCVTGDGAMMTAPPGVDLDTLRAQAGAQGWRTAPAPDDPAAIVDVCPAGHVGIRDGALVLLTPAEAIAQHRDRMGLPPEGGR